MGDFWAKLDWGKLVAAGVVAVLAGFGLQVNPAATPEQVAAIVKAEVEPLRKELGELREKIAGHSERLKSVESAIRAPATFREPAQP